MQPQLTLVSGITKFRWNQKRVCAMLTDSTPKNSVSFYGALLASIFEVCILNRLWILLWHGVFGVWTMCSYSLLWQSPLRRRFRSCKLRTVQITFDYWSLTCMYACCFLLCEFFTCLTLVLQNARVSPQRDFFRIYSDLKSTINLSRRLWYSPVYETSSPIWLLADQHAYIIEVYVINNC